MRKSSNYWYKLVKLREEFWSTPAVYILLLTTMLSVYFLLQDNPFFRDSPFFRTDDDNARYLVSAIIQSKAAIIVIVVTLSLVAVQFTASYYS